MTRTFLLAFCLTFVTTELVAQEPNPHNGQWLARFTTKKGVQRTAILKLNDAGGTWKDNVRIKQDMCVGMEAPVTVTRATSTELAFRIHSSKALLGCKDSGARLSRTGDKSFEGKMSKGLKVTLERQ
jgi:hypothetical protein